jgi:chaperone modulatory protein CbpM
MVVRRTEVVLLEARSGYTADELIDLSGLPREAVQALVDVGVLEARSTSHFGTEHVTLARAARRLREHFELDDNGLAVAVALLRRINALEARLVTHGTAGSED